MANVDPVFLITERRILVLADESADWIVAGIRQLDRIALAANEFAITSGSRVALEIFWLGARETKERWFPRDMRLTRCHATEAKEIDAGPYEAVMTTRIFIGRGGFGEMLTAMHHTDAPVKVKPDEVHQVIAQIATRVRAYQTRKWWYIDGASQIDSATSDFLKTCGRRDDGVVARLINRPLSRAITRWLLPVHVRPNTLTIAAFAFPTAGFLCVADGSKVGLIAGAFCFLIYSIVSGCDGEFARAKYHESAKGKLLDLLSGALAMSLLVFGNAVGLFRGDNGQSPVLAEGIGIAVIIFANGIFALSRSPTKSDDETLPATRRTSFRDFRLHASPALTRLLKFDLAYLLFVFVAFVQRADLFIHAIGIVAGAKFVMNLRARRA